MTKGSESTVSFIGETFFSIIVHQTNLFFPVMILHCLWPDSSKTKAALHLSNRERNPGSGILLHSPSLWLSTQGHEHFSQLAMNVLICMSGFARSLQLIWGLLCFLCCAFIALSDVIPKGSLSIN